HPVAHRVGELIGAGCPRVGLVVEVRGADLDDPAHAGGVVGAEQLHRVAVGVDAERGNLDAYSLPGEGPALDRLGQGRGVALTIVGLHVHRDLGGGPLPGVVHDLVDGPHGLGLVGRPEAHRVTGDEHVAGFGFFDELGGELEGAAAGVGV